MQLTAATLFLQVVFASGSIFFPLSSVNVTLLHTTVVPEPLPPLIELVLLQDIPDFLSGKTGPGEARFELIDDKSDGLFFIHENQLCVHRRFFTSDFSLPHDTKHYSLNIAGYLDNEGPASMWVNVILSKTKLTCALRKYELCFWSADTFQVAENLDTLVLGTLSSPLISALCPEFSVTYGVNKDNSPKWLSVQRHGNGLGGWVVALADRLDHEKAPVVSAKVDCTVTGGGDPPVLYTNGIYLKVRDIDDNMPKISFEPSEPLGPKIDENQTLAMVRIDDADGIDVNDLTVVVDSKNDSMRMSCAEESNTSTILTCAVLSNSETEFTENMHFTVIVTDKALVPGYGSKTIEKEFQLKSPAPRVESLVDDSPDYPAQIWVSVNAQKWSRVAVPVNKVSPAFMFCTNDDRFGVTETEGIVYVKNPSLLKIGDDNPIQVGLHVADRPQTFRNISLKVKALKEPPTPCKTNVSRLERREGNVEWCAELSDSEECYGFCGNGIRQPSHRGGCHWLFISQDPGRKYWTCVADPKTCPDDRCDALEQLSHGLCPQDCAVNVKGTGSKALGGKGIFQGEGICHWDPMGDWCQCSKEYNATYDDIQPSELTPTCDGLCQATLGTSAFLLALLIIVIIIFYIRKYRRMKKRCVSLPAKEELATMNYEEYVRRPLREPEPPARPDYFDAKWEFPRHRLTIEETIGEGEFGMVLKARADGIQNYDGSMTVAVKTLKNAAKDTELGDLVSELELLKDVDHPNVIRLLGACTTEGGPLYVIIEYAEYGSLRSYLRKHRPSTLEGDKEDSCYLEGVSPLTPKHILTFAWHIAKGMAYLTEMKLVHRDLAARNVLLTQDLVCKISDFGLTRDIYEDDTYLKRSKGRVPIKWMALESLADHVYTSKSDVWSYGVLLWELVTRGSSPYPGVAAQNLFNLLQDGYRMERPPGCSIELYKLMRACWAYLPAHRPSFAALVEQFDLMLAAGREYLDLCPGAVENRQYMDNAPHWVFQGYDHPRAPCGCPSNQCPHTVRYENHQLGNNLNEVDKLDSSIVQKV